MQFSHSFSCMLSSLSSVNLSIVASLAHHYPDMSADPVLTGGKKKLLMITNEEYNAFKEIIRF